MTPTSSNCAWPELEARVKLGLWRVTHEERHREDATQEAFVLGLAVGYDVEAGNMLGVRRPGALIADEPELLESWILGLEDGRETRLCAVAEDASCECEDEPRYECSNHFGHPDHEMALGLADFSGVTALAIDETSRARGHAYVTLAADAQARRVTAGCASSASDLLATSL